MVVVYASTKTLGSPGARPACGVRVAHLDARLQLEHLPDVSLRLHDGMAQEVNPTPRPRVCGEMRIREIGTLQGLYFISSSQFKF